MMILRRAELDWGDCWSRTSRVGPRRSVHGWGGAVRRRCWLGVCVGERYELNLEAVAVSPNSRLDYDILFPFPPDHVVDHAGIRPALLPTRRVLGRPGHLLNQVAGPDVALSLR